MADLIFQPNVEFEKDSIYLIDEQSGTYVISGLAGRSVLATEHSPRYTWSGYMWRMLRLTVCVCGCTESYVGHSVIYVCSHVQVNLGSDICTYIELWTCWSPKENVMTNRIIRLEFYLKETANLAINRY